jgi:hypothetical protein
VPLGEGLIERAECTPRGYAIKVRVLAGIYVALNLVCLATIALVLSRGRHLVTLAQRSNVETLLLAIVLALSVFYLVTTFRGFIGALRMAALNLPGLWSRDRAAIEKRKHDALPDGGEPFAVHLDKALESHSSSGPIRWRLADEIGELGEVELCRATATVKPRKHGLNNSVLAFLLGQVLGVLGKRTPSECVTIAFWSNIDEEGASVYRSTVVAFGNLAQRLGGEPLWPTIRLGVAEIERIGEALRQVVPALRNEALLPDLEYEVEYTIPVLPEPLAFLQLRRSERRADPVLTMGYALVIMTLVLIAVIGVVLWPPWVPSK